MAIEIDNLVSERGEVVKNRRRMPDGSDSIVFDDDSTIGEDSALGVHGDDGRIMEYRNRLRHRRRPGRRRFHYYLQSPSLCLGWCFSLTL